jgi:hypothetical protein
MKKTSVSYIKGKTINLEIDVEFASLFQNFLLQYITSAKDHQEVIDGYKKFEKILNGEDIPLTEYQTYLYALTALCQNIQKTALEQGAAKNIEMPEDIVNESKDLAKQIMTGEQTENLQERFKELSTKISNLS